MLPALAVLSLLAAAPSPSLSDAELRAVVITLYRGMCYGDCPVYFVRITGDGRVFYKGSLYVAEKGSRTTRIRRADVRKLVAAFEKAGYFSLPPENPCEEGRRCEEGYMTDSPSATISMTLRGKTHEIQHDSGCLCAPDVLFDLESAIDKASRSWRWVGKNRGGQWAGMSQ